MCSSIEKKDFQTKTGSFNVSLFDAVFVTVARKILTEGVEKASITQAAFDALKSDEQFKSAITHSTSHVESVKTRLRLACKYLYGIELEDNEEMGWKMNE